MVRSRKYYSTFGSFSQQSDHHERNEDRCVFKRCNTGVLDHVFAVFDGHGGDECSEFVSSIIIKQMESHFMDEEAWLNYEDVIVDLFRSIDKIFCNYARKVNDFSGACATVCALKGDQVLVANIGDCKALLLPVVRRQKSRVVRGMETLSKNFRKPKESGFVHGLCVPLTVDHRADGPAEKLRMFEAGGFVKEGRIFSLEPSRSFGDIDVKYHELATNKEIVIAKPDVDMFVIEQRSTSLRSSIRPVLIIATDGIWDHMTDKEVVSVTQQALTNNNKPEDIARALVEASYAQGSTDDITVIVVLL